MAVHIGSTSDEGIFTRVYIIGAFFFSWVGAFFSMWMVRRGPISKQKRLKAGRSHFSNSVEHCCGRASDLNQNSQSWWTYKWYGASSSWWSISILQYADDTILFKHYDLKKVCDMKLLLCGFEQLLWLNINYHKSDFFSLARHVN